MSNPGGRSWPPPPGSGSWSPQTTPRRGRGPAVALILICLLVAVGLGTTTVLLLRQVAAGPPGTTSVAAVQTVRGPALTYQVPGDWTVAEQAGPEPDGGIALTGVADGPRYECGSADFVRGLAGTLVVPSGPDPGELASTVARDFATSGYQVNGPPEVQVGSPTPRDVGGLDGVLVEATVVASSSDGCLATDGVVLALAVPLPDGASTAVLLVNGDLAGGPAEPPSPQRADLDAIVDSARPTGI